MRCVWCGVVWCGMVWYGVVWRGMAWWCVRSITDLAHLLFQARVHPDPIRKDRPDPPTHRDPHLLLVVDCPDANLFAGVSAVSQELLALLAHQQGETDGEPLARVPEEFADEGHRETDVIPRAEGEVFECWAEEEGVPQPQDHPGSEERLPVVVLA
jgi:hypothetical protein